MPCGAQLAEVAAAGREQAGRVGVFYGRQRGVVGDLPAARRSRDRLDEDGSGRVVSGDDLRAGVMDTVGDQNLVAGVVVLADRPAGRDAVLLVAVEVLDAEQDAAGRCLHGSDAAGLPFADDVGERAHLRRGVIHAGHPEVSLVAPGPRMLLVSAAHQIVGRAVRFRVGAEGDVAQPREEPAPPADGFGGEVDRETHGTGARRRSGLEGPRTGGFRETDAAAGTRRDAGRVARLRLQRRSRLDVDRQQVGFAEVRAVTALFRFQPARRAVREPPLRSEEFDRLASLRLEAERHRFGIDAVAGVFRVHFQLEIDARPRRDVIRAAGRPGRAVRIGLPLDDPDLLPRGRGGGPEDDAGEQDNGGAVHTDRSRNDPEGSAAARLPQGRP